MRNPILASPDRPIPLPDCILMDGWWAQRQDGVRGRSSSVLRLVIGEHEEGPHERPQRDERRAD